MSGAEWCHRNAPSPLRSRPERSADIGSKLFGLWVHATTREQRGSRSAVSGCLLLGRQHVCWQSAEEVISVRRGWAGDERPSCSEAHSARWSLVSGLRDWLALAGFSPPKDFSTLQSAGEGGLQHPVRRQTVTPIVHTVVEHDGDAYFRTRPFLSHLADWCGKAI